MGQVSVPSSHLRSALLTSKVLVCYTIIRLKIFDKTENMLSGIVLTLNSENTLEKCLKSLSICDEIIIVDSFSSDKTISLAKKYTENIYRRKFLNYGEQLNWAIEKAQGDWILVLDSDEELSEQLKNEIKREIMKENTFDAYRIPRMSKFLGRWIKFSWKGDEVIRLIKKGKAKYNDRELGSSPEIHGKTGKLKGKILHHPYKNISHYIEKLNYYTERAEKEMEKNGKKASISDLIFRPPLKFLKMYILKGGIFDGVSGLVLSLLSSFYVFVKYAKLWEKK